jgi:hypothetical protein
LEGKYWKRKLATVTAEYKKWRMFYKNKIMGWTAKDGSDTVNNKMSLMFYVAKKDVEFVCVKLLHC